MHFLASQDYYYYPSTRIYFNVTTGYYYYPYKNHWRKVRRLPRHYHIHDHHRVKIRIKSKDQPYLRHHEHHRTYGTRTRYYRDDHRYKDKDRSKYKDRYKDRDKVKHRTHDYYYYPKSRVYYNQASGHYYYPERNKWKRIKKLPSRYRLNHKERVKVKVKSKDRPYLRHNEHRTRYAPRTKYKNDSGRVKRDLKSSGFKVGPGGM